jgi:predicted GNAT superfamily acetyltransferase
MASFRDLKSLAECQQVVDLEKRVWGYTDAEDVVPAAILLITVKRGGVLIGAYDEGEMVGFVYSLPGIRDRVVTQWSHMLGVLPEYRGSGLGYELKLQQRLRTLDMGLDLVEWTYDPLQAANAHLNFAKLGVVVEHYEENVYGDSSSALHQGTPTDRFIAEWWVRSPGVEARLSGAAPAPRTLLDAPHVNRTEPAGVSIRSVDAKLTLSELILLVHIPTGFSEMQQNDPTLARAWRSATREIFTTYLSRGYRVTDFVLNRPANRGTYILTLKN